MIYIEESELDKIRERLAAAEARIQTLREAIKPFAEFAKLLDDFDDEHSVIRRKDWLVSDHRKAAAAYGDD